MQFLALTLSSTYSDFLRWMEENLLTCQIKAMTGHECMGCGLQRALVLLLKGEFLASLKMYPALMPMIVLFGALAGHLKFDWQHGASFLKWNFILVAILIIGNYVVKHII